MIPEHRRCSSLEEAAELLADLVKKQDGGDENYFNSQLKRYLYELISFIRFRAESSILVVTTSIRQYC